MFLLIKLSLVSVSNFLVSIFSLTKFIRIWEDSNLSWLSAAANFDNEEQELGKSLENESVYMGKKLTTDTVVPGRLCRDGRYSEFYRSAYCLICFQEFETKLISHSEATFNFFNFISIVIFEFDMNCAKPLQVNWNRKYCTVGGCQFCLWRNC